jgi:Mannosyltransferase (PIG-M)
MGLTLGSGLLFGRRKQDLVFTWFVQTVVFVLFNKVCTSQVCIILLYSSSLRQTDSEPIVLLVVSPVPPASSPSPVNYARSRADLRRRVGGDAGAVVE